ncbi:MAG: hypothetical protein WAW23_02055 [Candidatus Methanoperedens sp.]
MNNLLNSFGELRKEKLAHSEKLIKEVFRPVIIDKIMFTTISRMESNNDNKNLKHASEHLRKGYADTWKLLLECVAHKDNVLEYDNIIKDDIINKLKPDIPPFGFSRDITVENIELLIYKTIDTLSKGGRVLPDNYRAHLSLFGFNVVDHNEKYLVDKKEIFRKRIEIIIKDKNLYEKFKILNQEKELLEGKTNKFKQDIKDIIYDFEENHIALKATCKDCKGKGWWLLWGT